LAVRGIANPLAVIHYQKTAQVQKEIIAICRRHQPCCLVWGLSGGPIRRETERLARKIAKMVKLPVEFVDETLTSRDAQNILANRKGKHRDDAVAAALILEYFLAERG